MAKRAEGPDMARGKEREERTEGSRKESGVGRFEEQRGRWRAKRAETKRPDRVESADRPGSGEEIKGRKEKEGGEGTMRREGKWGKDGRGARGGR